MRASALLSEVPHDTATAGLSLRVAPGTCDMHEIGTECSSSDLFVNWSVVDSNAPIIRYCTAVLILELKDGTGIELRWGRDFRHPLTQRVVQWVLVFSPRGLTTRPCLPPRLKIRTVLSGPL